MLHWNLIVIDDCRDKKIDISQEMRNQLGEGGLISQNQINLDRENHLLGQWKQLLKTASSNSLLGDQQNKFLLSVAGQGAG